MSQLGQDAERCSFDEVDKITNTLQMVVHIPTFFLGLLLNLLAIRHFGAFLKTGWSGHMATATYMINLAVFDLLLVLSLPFKIVLSYKKWPLSDLCTLVESLYFVSMYGSIFTICFISVDRFLAIQFPLLARSLRSARTTLGVCCGIWVLVWVGSIPVYSFHRENEEFRCFHNMSNSTWTASVVLPLELFGFLLPLGVMTFCSSKIILVLLSRLDRIQNWAQQRACIWTVATSLAIFVVSFLPVHLGLFLQFLVHSGVIVECKVRQNISLFLQLSQCFSNLNCCLDVFCYYFVIKEFRMGLVAHQPSQVRLVLQDTSLSPQA